MQYLPPICVYCRHFHRGDDVDAVTCSVFPKGIPETILQSRHDHRQPYDGDGGVLFELRPRVPKERFADLLDLLGFGGI